MNRTVCYNNQYNKIVSLNGRKLSDTFVICLKTNGVNTIPNNVPLVVGREYEVDSFELDGQLYYAINEKIIDKDGNNTIASLIFDTIESSEHNFSNFFYTPDQLRDSKISKILTK